MTLALKYRPHTLTDLIGQEHITLVLREMLRRHDLDEITMPTGLLFTGPRGCGKTSAARIVAAALNCEATEPPCTECARCGDIQSGRSDAVIEVDGATSGLVADVRQLATTARLTHSGKYRVIIIDEVHAASPEAFSALLKQLEEPPPNVVYILVTTDYQMVPSTIKSRCLVFMFNAISEEAIAGRLEYALEAEWKGTGHLYQPEVMPLIAKRARGSMRDALMMLEQLTILKRVDVAQFNKLWPDDLPEFALQFVTTASMNDVPAGLAIIRKTFLTYHDNGIMTDSITHYLASRASDYVAGKGLQGEVISPRAILNLMQRTWEMRVLLRAASLADPIVMENLWFVFAKELAGAALPKNTQSAIVVEKRGATDQAAEPWGELLEE